MRIVPLINDEHWNYKNTQPAISLNDYCLFNFYINYVEKVILKQDYNEYDQVWAAYRVLEKIFYFGKYKIDRELKYTDIWKDPQKFAVSYEQVFLGTEFQIIDFDLKKHVFDQKLREYRATVANPIDYYNQHNNLFWKTWCFFLMIHHNVVGETINNILSDRQFDILQKVVDKHHNQCLTITNDLTYFYPTRKGKFS